MSSEDLRPFLEPTPTIESRHPEIEAFARRSCGGSNDAVDRAVGLYYAVRDGIRYDPYALELSVEGLRATTTLQAGRGWCVAKAILLAAACRALAIPVRLGFADVRNHLSTARMRENMKTDVFFWHGYVSIQLGGRWVRATPAFNVELCQKFRIRPLEFDGRRDSIFHPFDEDGNRHMEYLSQRGEFADVPMDAIAATFREYYQGLGVAESGDFDREVDAENADA
jgi:transglutaminase-like putative cysteine protease